MDGALTVRLPAAPPQRYLAWMSFWREVEDRMIRNPALERAASSESAPFRHDPIAELLSGLAFEIVQQFQSAMRTGAHSVEPELTVDRAQLAQGLRYVERRRVWLSRPGALEALGVAPIDQEVFDLRESVIDALRDAIETDRTAAPT